MHKKRLESLESILSSCIRHEQLTVTGLGRGIGSEALEKHNIKRADRLLSNKHLHSELKAIYQDLSKSVMEGIETPVILVDWSNLDSRETHFLLRASIALQGRSITIYEEVHTAETKERRKTHNRFLQNLSKVIPKGATPIIVTDAGFKITWFKEVAKYGWNWVGRIRGRMKVDLAGNSDWIEGRALFPKASSTAKMFDDAVIGKQNNLNCQLVLFKAKPKGRVMLTKFGKRKQGIRAKRAAKAQKEPWLLATSLPNTSYSPKQIVNIYSSRMQIEESFRDMKCSQYGIGLKSSRTYKKERLQVLVVIAALVNAFTWILGKATHNQNSHRQFQANTVKKTNVLSFVFIGLKVFKKTNVKIMYESLIKAWKDISLLANGIAHTC